MKGGGGERSVNLNLVVAAPDVQGLGPQGRWQGQGTTVKVTCGNVGLITSPETVTL